MVEVRNNGVPLVEQAPKAAITQSIVALAETLCGGVPKAETRDQSTTSKAVEKLRNLWPGRPRTPAAK
jgi:pilus assembly protein CpaE